MPVASHFTHRRNHRPDAQEKAEEAEEMEEVAEVGETAEEAGYLPQLDLAYSPHTDALLILISFLAASRKHSQETGQKLNPSSRNGSCTAESTPTTLQSKTSTKRRCCS
jgi:hypothetical protein